MYLEIAVFILLLIIQLVVGLYSATTRGSLSKKYGNILGSLKEMGRTLEDVMGAFGKFNVKVKVLKNLNKPVLEKDGVLYVNRDSIYRSDLYSNYLVIYELAMIYEGGIVKKVRNFINLLFLFQLLLFVFSLFITSNAGLRLIQISIGVEVFLIFFSFLVYLISEGVFRHIQEISVEILSLDDVESARAESLNKDLKLSFLEYSLKPIKAVVDFFRP